MSLSCPSVGCPALRWLAVSGSFSVLGGRNNLAETLDNLGTVADTDWAMFPPARKKDAMRLPNGYRIVDSGDRLAPWEVVAPDGRTVCIAETRREGVELAHADTRERR